MEYRFPGAGTVSDNVQVNTETVVPEGSNNLEAGSATIPPHDPYQLSTGILSEDELASLRLQRKGKRLASHHIRQNEVKLSRGHLVSRTHINAFLGISSLNLC